MIADVSFHNKIIWNGNRRAAHYQGQMSSLVSDIKRHV